MLDIELSSYAETGKVNDRSKSFYKHDFFFKYIFDRITLRFSITKKYKIITEL